MYGGMNRNEIYGLLALVAVVSLGLGAQGYRGKRNGEGLWVEAPASTKSTLGSRAEGTGSASPMLGLAGPAPAPDDRGETGRGFAAMVTPGSPSLEMPSTAPAATPPSGTAPSGMGGATETSGLLDINSATQADWEGLPLIGEKKAQAILDYRERMGGRFRSLEEVQLAAHLGETQWARIRPLLTMAEPGETPSPGPSIAAGPGSSAQPLSLLGFRAQAPAVPDQAPLAAPPGTVNINTASIQELDKTLWNVGPKTAAKIVEWRAKHGPFRRAEDLMQVPGVGPVTLQKNLHKIRVAP